MPGKEKLLFIGDSLTEWCEWGARFPNFDIANLGISGETVDWLLERLPRITSTHDHADRIFLMTGINNIAMDDISILKDYEQITQLLRSAYPDATLHIQSLLPVIMPWVKPEVIEHLNAKLKSMARVHGADYLDIHADFILRGVRDCLQPDGVHLSDTGYEVWTKHVAGVLGVD